MNLLESEYSYTWIRSQEDTVSTRLDGNRIILDCRRGCLSIDGRRIPYETSENARYPRLSFRYERNRYVMTCFGKWKKSSHKRIRAEGLIRIGSAIEDDLYIREETIGRAQITIDFTHGTVRDEGGMHHLYLNGRRKQSAVFHTGDRLFFYGIEIIFLQRFFLLSAGRHVFTALSAYEEAEEELMECRPVYQSAEAAPLPDLHMEQTLHAPHLSAGETVSFWQAGPSLTMSGASAFLMILLYAAGHYGSITMILFPLIMFLSSAGWFLARRHHEKRERLKEKEEADRKFLEVLADIEKTRKEMISAYTATAYRKYPDLLGMEKKDGETVFHAVGRYDPDFLKLPAGSCLRPVDVQIHLEGELPDETCRQAYEEMMRKLKKEAALPFFISFQQYPHILVHDQSEDHSFARYLVLALLGSCRPDDLSLVIIHEEPVPLQLYSCAHCQSGHEVLICSATQFIKRRPYLREAVPHACIFICCTDLPDELFAPDDMVLWLTDHYHPCDLYLSADERSGLMKDCRRHTGMKFLPAGLPEADGLALLSCLALLPHHHQVSCCGLKEVNRMAFDPEEIRREWQKNHHASHLKGVLGMNEEGEMILLDLHEKGDGPHGLLAGTTGSGKSECLISFLLSLAMHYSPADLQIILIDFKGTGLQQACSYQGKLLPHIAGSLSNLDRMDAERALVSFHRECSRREALFARMHEASGHDIASLDDYHRAYRPEYHLPDLAHLFIVIDEFAQLKKEIPGFMEELIAIARVGRSLGMHMLLSTQKPGGVISSQIAANTRYRICLRVNDRQESRDVIASEEAGSIHQPGEFYLRVDGQLKHGYAGYSAQPYRKEEETLAVYDEHGQLNPELEEHVCSERQALMRVLVSIPVEKDIVHSLWPPQLTQISWTDLKGSGACGLLDDFHSGSCRIYVPARHVLVLSDDPSAVESFLAAYIYYMHLYRRKEIYLISSSSAQPRVYRKLLNGWIPANDEDMLDRLEEKRKEGRHIGLILRDAASFLEEQPAHEKMLWEWLRQMDSSSQEVLVCLGQTREMPHRMRMAFADRLVLACGHEQEISDFLERPYHQVFRGCHAFLKRDDRHCLQGIYPSGTEKEMKPLPPVPCTLPPIPSRPAVPHGSHAVGIFMDDLELFVPEPQRHVIVTAIYDVYLYPLFHLLKERKEDVSFIWDDQPCKSHFIFMIMDQYEKSTWRTDPDRYLLFVGPGFHKQYVLKAYLKRDLKETEALLFDHQRPRRLRLVQKEENK